MATAGRSAAKGLSSGLGVGVITGSEAAKEQEKEHQRLMLIQLHTVTAANAKMGMMLIHLWTETWCRY